MSADAWPMMGRETGKKIKNQTLRVLCRRDDHWQKMTFFLPRNAARIHRGVIDHILLLKVCGTIVRKVIARKAS